MKTTHTQTAERLDRARAAYENARLAYEAAASAYDASAPEDAYRAQLGAALDEASDRAHAAETELLDAGAAHDAACRATSEAFRRA